MEQGGDNMRKLLIIAIFSVCYAQVRSLDENSPFFKNIEQKSYEIMKNNNFPIIQAGPLTFYEDSICISEVFTYMSRLATPDNGLIGDFDNNGYNDIISIYIYDALCFSTVVGCFQNGPGNFIFKRLETQYLACGYGIAAYDLNNDGRMDFVYIDVGGGELMRLINNGNQNFTDQVIIQSSISDTFWYINHVAVISPNEILFTDEGQSNGQKQGVHRWNGVSSSKINTYCSEGLAVADLNNDGQKDLVCSGGYFRGPKNVVFQLKNGSTWSPIYNITSTPGLYHGVAVGDINNDGRIDVVFGDDQNDVILVYRNNGGNPPTFSQIASIPVGSDLRGSEVKLFDLDCDGDLDILWARGMGKKDGYTNPGPAAGWINNPTIGGGGWTNYIIDNSNNSNYGIIAGFLNKDTRPDVIVSAHNKGLLELAYLRVFYNIGGGNCGPTPVSNNESDDKFSSFIIKNNKIIFEVQKTSQISFSIYSIDGKIIKSFQDKVYTPGKYEIPINLKPGLYLINAKINNNLKSKTFVKYD